MILYKPVLELVDRDGRLPRDDTILVLVLQIGIAVDSINSSSSNVANSIRRN